VIAHRLYGAAKPGEVRCFSDVPTDAWYRTAVCSLAGQAVISGFENNTFRPTQSVQSAEVLKIIIAAFNIEVERSEASPWYTPYRTSVIHPLRTVGMKLSQFRGLSP
jgi:hypothetical protein